MKDEFVKVCKVSEVTPQGKEISVDDENEIALLFKADDKYLCN